MLVSRRVSFFVCLFPLCSDVPIKMEGLITMQFQIWVCHRGCLQFNTWVRNPKELFVNGCLVLQPFSIYVKVWNHPVETTIYKWLALGFQGGIYCEALGIQTHMMRIGMNEPPFTSPEPKKQVFKGFQTHTCKHHV